MMKTETMYESPQLNLVVVSAELGFATSGFGEAGAAGAQGEYVTIDDDL